MSLEVKIEELTKVIIELNSNIAKIINSSRVEDTNEAKVIPEPTKEVKEVSEPNIEVEPEEELKVSLDELKELAKERAKVSGREKTKAIISEHGKADKLTDVELKYYNNLAEKLKV